jgi:hypothetical protein
MPDLGCSYLSFDSSYNGDLCGAVNSDGNGFLDSDRAWVPATSS